MDRKYLVKQGSLTDGDELVLVNAANTNVALGSGVSGAIRGACGPGYQDRIFEQLNARYGGPMEPGHVLVTDAGAHPTARYVAHVAVMDYRQGFNSSSYPDPARIEACCRNLWTALEAIEDEATLSVAMVGLGAGTGNLGARIPTELACRTLQEHLERQPQSRIERVVYYGFQLFEYMAMLEVVSSFFEVPPETVPQEARKYLQRG